jgi:hypothetical protein
MSDPLHIFRDPRRHRHHPWRVFGTYTDWKLVWTDDLPDGTWGKTVFEEKRVLIANGLDEAERRCTIAHETRHIVRGPFAPHEEMREELIINRHVGRLLAPSVRWIGHALAWHQADHEKAAWELWVDDDTLAVRLSSLTPRERAHLDEQLALITL